MDVMTAFLAIGAIILVGFIGVLMFDRLKIPDILLLILIGLLIGPVLTLLLGQTLVSTETLTVIAPFIGTLALIIILFDGGLNLNYDNVMNYLGISIVHTVVIFVVNIVLVAIFFTFILGFPLLVGLLLGTVISGTSSAVVIPLLAGTRASEEAKTLLVLESVLTDVMCIVTALTVITILKGTTVDAGTIAGNLITPFAVAGLIGGLFGILWLYVLKKTEGKPFAFMITIAALFVLFGLTEYIRSNGLIAVLVFGLVLSNRDEFARILRIKTKFVLNEHIQQFHGELSFVVRTFFFVYLGMVFTFNTAGMGMSPNHLPGFLTSSSIVLFAFAMAVVMVLLLIARAVGSTVTTTIKKGMRRDLGFMLAMLPGGLTAAVLAQIPFTVPEFRDTTSAYYRTLAPYQSIFLNIVFIVIVLSVIITTIGVYISEKRLDRNGPRAPSEPKPLPRPVHPIFKRQLPASRSGPRYTQVPSPKPSNARVAKPPTPQRSQPAPVNRSQPVRPAQRWDARDQPTAQREREKKRRP
ncbi:MAG: cation:proton antiporter [Euryarchaeota archaeon]|nr:cation:proton antiporter [Euryarchaeota archaeon]